MKDISPSFCVHPWVNLMVNTTSYYNFCCIAADNILRDEQNNIIAVSNTTPDQAWNCKSIRNARKAMVDGEKLSICKTCWLQEDIGKESYRQKHNKEWTQRLGEEEINRRVQETIDNDYFLSTTPDYLDLRLGSICNLKCRMCNIWNSNQIEKEHHVLKQNNSYTDLWTRHWNSPINIPTQNNDWVEADELWDNLSKYIPDLKKVYFTGGEPTLIDANYQFLAEIIKYNLQDKIDIMFNTNCTNIQQRWLDVISKFKNVQINASIDGTGKVNDYIRSRSNWYSVDKNFLKIASLPNVNVDMSPVIQIYNVLHIGNILEYAEESSKIVGRIIDVDFLLADQPAYMHMLNLSDKVRDLAYIKLSKWQGSWLYDRSLVTKNSIDSYLTLLESKRLDNWEQNMKDFWNITDIYDKTRKQSFQQCIPELYEKLYAEK